MSVLIVFPVFFQDEHIVETPDVEGSKENDDKSKSNIRKGSRAAPKTSSGKNRTPVRV